jgi:hydrogenase expression/formation protein HypE
LSTLPGVSSKAPPADALKAGKLPAELLSRLLASVSIDDPRVLLSGSVGEDAALISYGERLLIAKSDPVTFATERIGWYAVNVNANDVAACGGDPKWFLATVLLPEGASPLLAEQIFHQIRDACRELGVALIGGHTEVTVDLRRPLVSGTMLGEVLAGSEIRTGGAEVGDRVLLTGGIAIEGTAILASEADQRLESVDRRLMERAAQFLDRPGISVVAAARAIRGPSISSLHDPTEGGLAGALAEVCEASQTGVEIDEEAVPVLPETRAICDVLQLDPWGLIASGALLATARPDHATHALAQLEAAGIQAWEIGHVTRSDRGRTLRRADGRRVPLPTFERDELARYFEAAHSSENAGS